MDISPYTSGATLSGEPKILFANQVDHPKPAIIPNGWRWLRLQVLALKGATFQETVKYRKDTAVIKGTVGSINHGSSGGGGEKKPYLYFGFIDVENGNPLTHSGKLDPKIIFDGNCILEYMEHPLIGWIFNESKLELSEFKLPVKDRKLHIPDLRDWRDDLYGRK